MKIIKRIFAIIVSFFISFIIGLGVITIKIINSDENDKFFSHF